MSHFGKKSNMVFSAIKTMAGPITDLYLDPNMKFKEYLREKYNKKKIFSFGRRRRHLKRHSKSKSRRSKRKSRRSRKSIGGCRIKRKPRGSRQKTYFTNKSDVEYVKVNPRCGVRRRRRSRRFGYTHDNNGELYGVHYDDGMLLANDAFGFENNPLNRALNAGSG